MWKSKKTLPAWAMVSIFAACTAASATEQQPSRHVVIVELFTSQGCSSCPPADRLLSRLAGDDSAEVIPLSFHVDYWNYIGWTDPFSSAAWSERQTRYARQVFGTSRIYTPQVVVNGRGECVGSNEKQVRQKIAEARRQQAAGQLDVNVRPGVESNRLSVEIDAHIVPLGGPRGGNASAIGSADRKIRDGTADTDWDVMVALFENDLVTPVPRGENTGRKLKNTRVVRRLEKAFSLPARPGSRRSERYEIEIDAGWKRDRLGVAVFLQDSASLEIHGAALMAPAAQ